MKEIKNQPTQDNLVSFKWTTTLFLAFCFLLFAQDSKGKNSQQDNSEITTENVIEQKINAHRQ